MDNMRYREALHLILYSFKEDLNWYQRRSTSSMAKSRVLRQVAETLVRLLAPFAPHICEELWEKMGFPGYVSLASWPEINPSLLDFKAEVSEYLVKTVIEDTTEILKVTGIQPKGIYYYVSPQWHWQIYNEVLKLSKEKRLDTRTVIRQLMALPEVRIKDKEAAKVIQRIIQHVQSMSPEIVEAISQAGTLDEYSILAENLSFISSVFKCSVQVFKCDDPHLYDPRGKSQQSLPLKPAIYVES
ncbi:MAG: hypothetical protein DRJ33_08580 [Candidatus Methanomethylicota archaeon]|uniref:Methionyl/Valyl/Leucyl/Isoleucyl-tRNA synthetase anticodon-binding domain-containing protein n=1 Tax=Thermoproteota archaeon TaxID=2056631 RepID=A0A497ENX1_9CREN|nr:MAG: hypothetical protein DRJ33_08580 [Candidatus Verstraetearchaeota archaeon]